MAPTKEKEVRAENSKPAVDSHATPDKTGPCKKNLIRFTLLTWESREQFFNLAEGAFRSLRPVGQVETTLVCTWIARTWQLQRLDRIETEVLGGLDVALHFSFVTGQRIFATLARYRSHLEDSRDRALEKLKQLQAERLERARGERQRLARPDLARMFSMKTGPQAQ